MHDDDATVREAVGNTNRLLKRWWIVCAAAVVLVLVVAGGSFLVSKAKGSDPQTVDHVQLESRIHTWAVKKEKADPSVKVSCPGDIAMKAGSMFHCLLTGGGQSVRLVVTIENDQGYLTWTVG